MHRKYSGGRFAKRKVLYTTPELKISKIKKTLQIQVNLIFYCYKIQLYFYSVLN